MKTLSPRSYQCLTAANSWEELWEAGPYYDRVSEHLEDAQRYVIIAGWQIDSRLPMRRPRRPETPSDATDQEALKTKILRLCEEKTDLHFYFLMWDHAYFYVAEREFWQGRIWDLQHPRIHFIFDNRHPLGGAHHEKTILFDGTLAVCGGIDLCDERWDTREHSHYNPKRSLSGTKDPHGPYHDMSVQITGPVCRILQKNMAYRWQSLSSVPFPEPAPSHLKHPTEQRAPELAVYVSRTQVDVDASIKMIREVEFLFRDLIGLAEQSIVLEGQYFWSRQIADLLIAKMRQMQGHSFELVIVLAELRASHSLTRMMAAYEGRLLERLQQVAKQTGTRLTMGTPYAYPKPDARGTSKPSEPRPIYVHSKLILIDDRFLCTGSANLNARAMRIDTEVNLTFEARTPAEQARLRQLREQVLRHWELDPSAPEHALHHSKDCGGIRLHPFGATRDASAALDNRSHQNEIKQYPYARLFDPLLPWGYALKRKVLLLARRKPPLIAAGIALIAIGAIANVLLLSASPPGWAWLYATLLTLAWLFPVPFFFTALLTSIHLGGAIGAPLAVYALWTSALLGYLASRLFPSFARAILAPVLPALHLRLGQRRFEDLLGTLADPRINLRSKVLAQGFYCMPLPWFLLSMGVLMPSAVWTLVRWADSLLPDTWVTSMRAHPAAGLAILLFWTAISGLRDTVAQHRAQSVTRARPEPATRQSGPPQRKDRPHAA